jgi:WD40 repeat protein
VAIAPGGEMAVSGYSDKAIKVWELASGAEVAIFTLDAAPGGCALSPDGKTIVVGDADGAVHFFYFKDHKPNVI